MTLFIINVFVDGEEKRRENNVKKEKQYTLKNDKKTSSLETTNFKQKNPLDLHFIFFLFISFRRLLIMVRG